VKNTFSPITHKKILIGLLVLVFIALSLYSTIFYFIGSKTREASVLIGELEVEVLKEQEIMMLKKAIAVSEMEREKLDSYFVKNDSVVDLIERIESIGLHAGVLVSFESISVMGEGQDLLELNFVSNGVFSDTFYFLSLLDSLPLTIYFEKIFIAKEESRGSQEDGTTDAWKGTFSMRVSSFLNE